MMILKIKGICGETLFFNPELLEFAYEINMLNTKVMYVGMKSGKKLFLNIDKANFMNLIKPFGVEEWKLKDITELCV